MDEITTPSRARKFWAIVGSFATVFAMMYAGAALQQVTPLFEGTNATAVVTYNFAESVATPVINKIKGA